VLINGLSLGEALSAAHLGAQPGIYPFGTNSEMTVDYGSLISVTCLYEHAKLAFMGCVPY